jgi:hypothetical protein
LVIRVEVASIGSIRSETVSFGFCGVGCTAIEPALAERLVLGNSAAGIWAPKGVRIEAVIADEVAVVELGASTVKATGFDRTSFGEVAESLSSGLGRGSSSVGGNFLNMLFARLANFFTPESKDFSVDLDGCILKKLAHCAYPTLQLSEP